MKTELYEKWVDMNCPDCLQSLLDDGSCNCVVYELRKQIRDLKKVVDIARYVNQLHPPSVYKLIEAMREFDA